jgi:hypothetical protein
MTDKPIDNLQELEGLSDEERVAVLERRGVSERLLETLEDADERPVGRSPSG